MFPYKHLKLKICCKCLLQTSGLIILTCKTVKRVLNELFEQIMELGLVTYFPHHSIMIVIIFKMRHTSICLTHIFIQYLTFYFEVYHRTSRKLLFLVTFVWYNCKMHSTIVNGKQTLVNSWQCSAVMKLQPQCNNDYWVSK